MALGRSPDTFQFTPRRRRCVELLHGFLAVRRRLVRLDENRAPHVVRWNASPSNGPIVETNAAVETKAARRATETSQVSHFGDKVGDGDRAEALFASDV